MPDSTPASGPALEEWVAELAAVLGVPELTELDIGLVLDLARDAAHGVARPAAPVTTFLVGISVGRAGGSSADIRRLVELVSRRIQPLHESQP